MFGQSRSRNATNVGDFLWWTAFSVTTKQLSRYREIVRSLRVSTDKYVSIIVHCSSVYRMHNFLSFYSVVVYYFYFRLTVKVVIVTLFFTVSSFALQYIFRVLVQWRDVIYSRYTVTCTCYRGAVSVVTGIFEAVISRKDRKLKRKAHAHSSCHSMNVHKYAHVRM